MSALPVFSVFGCLIGLLFLGGLVVLIVVLLRSGPTGAPGCGACGYAVAGLETLRCPECGADLREVGIAAKRTRGLSPGSVTLVLCVLYTILLPVPLLMVVGAIGRSVPRQYVNNYTLTLTPIDTERPEVELVWAGSGTTANSYDQVLISFRDEADRVVNRFALALPDQTWEIEADDGSWVAGEGPFGVDPLAQWFAGEGLDGEASDEYSTALVPMIRERIANPLQGLSFGGTAFHSAQQSSGSVTRQAGWLLPATVAGGGLIWIGGLLVIVWIVRRRTR